MHDVLPGAEEYVFEEQSVHDDTVRPLLELYEPAGHEKAATQALDEFDPTGDEASAGGHKVHEKAPGVEEYEPLLHNEHDADVRPPRPGL